MLDIHNLPYGSDIYIIATFFDHKFRLQWIENELELTDEQKEELKNEVTGIVQAVS